MLGINSKTQIEIVLLFFSNHFTKFQKGANIILGVQEEWRMKRQKLLKKEKKIKYVPMYIRDILELLIYTTILFESLGVLWVLLYPASRPNHTSYRKFYFYELVANFLPDNMGMMIFDLQGCGSC